MKKLKVMSIFGTRPETSKMAPVIKELCKYESIQSVVCVTAQHREMLDQTLNIFDLKPDYDLNIMQENQTLTDITTRAIKGIEGVLNAEKPDIVLAHGDTTTTFAAALAAFYAKIKVGHVEAGLRTFDRYQPFPEEMNRKLTTSLAELHFAPTSMAKENLLNEGIGNDIIFVTGNTAIDAIQSTVRDGHIFEYSKLNNIDFKNNRVITMTAHRRENIGEPLEHICNAVKRIVSEHKDVIFVYAVHPNPKVTETAKSILGDCDRVILTPPIGMLDMHNLMNKSYLIFTDSGGLQEEAPSLGKPVVVLRNVTERPEGIDAETLVLAGTDENKIYEITNSLLTDSALYTKMSSAKNPYGDGHAAERIVKAILYHFGYLQNRPDDFK